MRSGRVGGKEWGKFFQEAGEGSAPQGKTSNAGLPTKATPQGRSENTYELAFNTTLRKFCPEKMFPNVQGISATSAFVFA